MESYAIFLFTIGISLLLSKFLSGLAEKKGIPSVLGEIGAGIIIGTLILIYPSVTTVINPSTNEFDYLSRLGILFLLLLAGMQTDLKQLKDTGKVAMISTIGGVLVPLILGFFVIQLFGFSEKEAFGIGVMMTATSIGITVRVMMDLGVLQTRVGTASLSASVIDDFIGIALVVLATGEGDLWTLILNMVIFVFITLIIGWYAIDKVLYLFKKIPSPYSILAFVIGLMFIFATFAEIAFQAAIEGAFILGIIISRFEKEIIENTRSITYGFIAPLFFVHVGSILDIRVFGKLEVLFFAFTIVFLAFFGKITGRGSFAKMAGFSWRESYQMGVGSVPRMEVALISLMVVINAGIFTPEHIQVAIAGAMVFVTCTTLMTPSLLRHTFRVEIQNLHLQKEIDNTDSLENSQK